MEFCIVWSLRDSSTALDLRSECNFSFSTTTTLIRCFIPCSSSWSQAHTEMKSIQIGRKVKENWKYETNAHSRVNIPCRIWPQLPGVGCTLTGYESLGPNPENQANRTFPPVVQRKDQWQSQLRHSRMASKIFISWRSQNDLAHLFIILASKIIM